MLLICDFNDVRVAGGLAPAGLMRAAGAAGQKDAPLANTSRAAFTQKPAGVNNVNDNASAATPHYTSDGTAVGHLKLDLVGKNGPSGMASPPAGTMSPRGAAAARSPRTMRSPRGAMSPRTPRTKGPVTVVEPETPQDGLEVLMGKREGVIAMLNTIRATLFKNDELIGETQGEIVAIWANVYPRWVYLHHL